MKSVRSCWKRHTYQFRQVKHAILGNTMNRFWCLQFLSSILSSCLTQRAFEARTPSFLWWIVYRLCCWLCILRSNQGTVCGLSNGSSSPNLSEAFANHTLVLASRNRWQGLAQTSRDTLFHQLLEFCKRFSFWPDSPFQILF